MGINLTNHEDIKYQIEHSALELFNFAHYSNEVQQKILSKLSAETREKIDIAFDIWYNHRPDELPVSKAAKSDLELVEKALMRWKN